MIRFLRRQLDKLPKSPGIVRSGQWRVQYDSGEWTIRMTYDVARDYANIFGGAVHWIRYDDKARAPTETGDRT